MRTLAPWTLGRNLLLMASAVRAVEQVLREFAPTAVLATGGYVSAPAIYAAGRRGIPVVIYLPDLEPGWAIRTLSRWARCVAVSFDEVRKYFSAGKAVVTGYPVRTEFYKVTRSEGCVGLNLDPDQRVVTIFGGSQGAHSINRTVSASLQELLAFTQIVHISGRQDEAMMQSARAMLPSNLAERYHLFVYMDEEMPLALAAANLVVARAGAATLGEFPAVGAPSILVPYPFAGRHQEKNADFLVGRGAAYKLDDSQLGTDLAPTLAKFLHDQPRLGQMAANARAIARPDAASQIAQLLK